MPQISVIVAVYAAEKYLRQCLESLLNQTFQDFEVVLVDDGSKDDSGKICDEFAEKDSRIKVVHKENGGVASARQCGLENSIGEYVIHVDPDDWIEPVMLQEMLQKAVEDSSDMVICDFMKHENDTSIRLPQEPESLDARNVMREFFQNLHGSCCNKLVKRSLFGKYKISFPLHMTVWEDLFVCVMLTMHNIRISYIPKAFYHYQCSVNENSLVNQVSMRKIDSMLFFIHHFEALSDFDKKLLNRNKIDVKRCLFMRKGITKKEFFAMCSDVNELYVSRFAGFKKIDSLIRFALVHSWFLSRVLLFAWRTRRILLRSI
ncbi:glycosyltransferase family 2 protein [uncultured Fibrobacter sp.]|uniref:glycosyltransferase family 2 protein n=1 Tax=uncultured Fibrobacter sp. TaxID=261512 RepID=UPI00260CDEEA|nr:glycosyltransferase family 2 protein [uncultured Fibrobacter sp.]